MDFEELYQNYVGSVYGYLLFKLNDRQLTEDILQETFLAVHQNLRQFPKIASPKAWILSIAHNKMVDYLRKRSIPESHANLQTLGSESCEQDSNLFFRQALKQLADAERTIIYGLYVEGLTCQELARILNIPEGTVKSKAHYARKKLYQWLQEESGS